MKKLLYLGYLIKWHIEHFNEGMKPACYSEWLDNEYAEYLRNKPKTLRIRQADGSYVVYENVYDVDALYERLEEQRREDYYNYPEY